MSLLKNNSVMIRTIFIFFFLIYFSVDTPAQRVYELNTARESALIGGGLSGLVLSIPINKRISPLTEEEILLLDRSRILNLDQFPISQYSSSARKLSDKFLFSSPAYPLVLLADPKARDQIGEIGTMYAETAIINTAITELTKVIVKRTRPYVFNSSLGYKCIKDKPDSRKSFFSGHTSTVAAFSFFTAQVYSDLNPDGSVDTLAWATSAIIPAVTGYLRVKGGKHFPTDVIIGYIVGAAVGMLVPRLH